MRDARAPAAQDPARRQRRGLHVGSGFERKGVARCSRRWRACARSRGRIVVGKDKRSARYAGARARAWASRERVRFVGAVSDVRPYYAAADSFALATLYDPFPNAALEAMACGLPVVTTPKCGAAELLREGESGFVRDALDIAGPRRGARPARPRERAARWARPRATPSPPSPPRPWRASTSTLYARLLADNAMSARPPAEPLHAPADATSGPTAGRSSPASLAMIVGGLADAALVKLTGPADRRALREPQPRPRDPAAAGRGRGLPGERAGELHLGLHVASGSRNKVILDLRRADVRAAAAPAAGVLRRGRDRARLVAKFTNDVTNIAAASTSVLTVLVRDTVTIAALLAILLLLQLEAHAHHLRDHPAVAIVVRIFGKRLREMSRASQQAIGGIAAVLDEIDRQPARGAVFGGQDYEAKRFERGERAHPPLQHEAVGGRLGERARSRSCSWRAPIAAIIYFAAQQAFAGSTDVGRFVEFIAATGMLLQPLKRLTERERAPAEGPRRVRERLRPHRREARGRPRHRGARPRARRRSAIEGVSLSYRGGTRPALDDVTLDDPARRDRGAGGPLGQRQVEPHPPAAALLPSGRRAHHARRPRPRVAHAGEPAPPDLAGVAERGALQRHRRGEHRLRARCEHDERGRHRARGRGGARDGVHPRAAAGPRTRRSARTAPSSPAASASASRSRARSSRTRPSCCSTRPPRRSTPRASARCRPRSRR